MPLLERNHQLDRLAAAFDRTRLGRGSLMLLHGEAGAGKTTVVEHFVDSLPSTAALMLAACEPLFAARPLGPLLDVINMLPPRLAASIRDGDVTKNLFSDLLNHLQTLNDPLVWVIEDVHWADAGTLELLRYLGRRLRTLPVLVIATFRDDDLAIDHPLRLAVGELPAATIERIEIPSLSRAAVHTLAATTERDCDELFEVTGGNAFFVSEALRCADRDIPPSVADAVLSRFARLSVGARAVAEFVSISPKRLEVQLVSNLVGEGNRSLDECIGKGLLRTDGEYLSFRHDIARQTVERELKPGCSRYLHQQLFAALCRDGDQTGELARKLHHARGAGMRNEILALAPVAARAASEVSAHREAAKYYALTLEYANALHESQRAALLESMANEYRLTSDIDNAIAATRAALALRKELGDILPQGMNLRRLGDLLREKGQRVDAERMVDEAIAVLQDTAPSIELVYAYAEKARLLVWTRYSEAAAVGACAVALAESLGDSSALVDALHAGALARLYLTEDAEAIAQLRKGLQVAISEGMEDAAGKLYAALQLAGVIYKDFRSALEIAEEGVAFCEERDLDRFTHILLDNRALSLIELGRWDEADVEIARCLARPNVAKLLRNSLQFLDERQKVRRGLPGAGQYWIALQGDLSGLPLGYRVPAVATACVEMAWLRGDLDGAGKCAALGIESAVRSRDGRLLGPLLVWATRLEMPFEQTGLPVHEVYQQELSGDIAAAAAIWHERGCVYEQAMTLVHGDESQVGEALRLFNTLGAQPAAEIARFRLRALGVRSIPRGPLQRTQADPLGLTMRERQVYELLQQALSNGQIARRLHRSTRTIEHHVASIFGKLGVAKREALREDRCLYAD